MSIKWIKKKIKQESGFFIFLILSLLLHLSSYLNLKYFAQFTQPQDHPFKINMDDNLQKHKLVEQARRLVEAKQKSTSVPDHADYLGFQNHSTDKEQRSDSRYNTPAQDATISALDPSRSLKNQQSHAQSQNMDSQSFSFNKKKTKRKMASVYQKYLPSLEDTSMFMGKSSHVDELDKNLVEGKYTDVNTLEYKNIGYFVGMRKALESVWIYPEQARRFRYQGMVGIVFNLQEDGSVTDARVLKTSGYKVLDLYALRALNEASFAPPPKEVYEKSPFYWNFIYQIY